MDGEESPQEFLVDLGDPFSDGAESSQEADGLAGLVEAPQMMVELPVCGISGSRDGGKPQSGAPNVPSCAFQDLADLDELFRREVVDLAFQEQLERVFLGIHAVSKNR